MQKVLHKFTTCLWFDNDAKEAMEFYSSVFNNAKVSSIAYYGEAGREIHHREKGSVMTVRLELEGHEILGLNGGPMFKINPSISFYVTCKSAQEVEHLFEKLSAGGQVMMPLDKYPFSEKYAWVQDKFGVSWQLNFTDKTTQKISPCLMFTGKQSGRAADAIAFYNSIFKNSSVDYIVKYEEGEPAPGTVKHAAFKLDGQQFIAMDSPIEHGFDFSFSTSFMVNCDTQEEIDEMWERLQADGGFPSECGWLCDKFGVPWQVVPSILEKMVTDKDEAKREKVLACIMESKKLEIDKLDAAFRS